VSGKDAKPTKELELKEWKKKDLEARIEIIKHLSDEQVDLVKDRKNHQKKFGIL
jgi:hypothetical protein